MTYTSEFRRSETPPTTDYKNGQHWAALPDREDRADGYPANTRFPERQSGSKVDVFFVHPTIYTKNPGAPYRWNADVGDQELNREVDDSTIKFQASALNAAGRVFAPRYRQAHIAAFGTANPVAGEAALDVAYADVKASFQYYIAYLNHGRPFILASHSQGTQHMIRLIKELVDGQSLQKQLVVAYLVGMPVEKTAFNNLRPCGYSEEIGCVVSWRTYAKGFYPKTYKPQPEMLCTNPLSWTSDEQYTPHTMNKGGLLQNFDQLISGVSDAQCEAGFLRTTLRLNPATKWFLRKLKNYHVADYNLYYESIRENAVVRAGKFTLQAGR
ncbi:MAG: DUF3089 domain-containing protein [Bacteroidetes Order II. Incertae sedis bacterium]|nr:DUF3089 domain-containing protein [Bacteroidetes Order II. bacterium]